MKNNKKFMWKIAISAFTILMMLTLLSTAASASISVYTTPLDATNPPGTVRLCGGCNHIDYTAVAASKTDPRIVQFKDLSKGKETYIRWDFGDGTHLEGTKITPALKNPVHKFSKPGYYISCLTIKCTGYKCKLWVHKTIVTK